MLITSHPISWNQRDRRVRADEPAGSDLAHRPDVCAVRNPVRRQLVLPPVPGEEGDLLAADLADRERRRRLAVWRLELDLLDVRQERVEPRAAEDADLSFRHSALSSPPLARRPPARTRAEGPRSAG